MKTIEPLHHQPAPADDTNTTSPEMSPLSSATPYQETPSVIPAPMSIDSQWQTRQEYAANRPSDDQTVRQHIDGTRLFAYALAISVFVLLLANITPLGDLFASSIVDSRTGKTISSNPLAAIALVATITSYFSLLITAIVKRVRAKQSKGGMIALLVTSILVVFNPISAIILLMAFVCNLSPCQST